MIIVKKITDVQQFLAKRNAKQKSTGFVPTMGALHDGHISLIKAAKKETGVVVCSIFVNPTQFNDPKDFEKYPVTIESDIYLLEKAGCDVLFLPAVAEMYPQGLQTSLHFELGFIETILEGEFRPGHFQGVCQVVYRLLEIITPDKLFLGQKDFQQCMVIRKMAATFFPGLDIIICPTQRESSGLAMSSRNKRLSDADKITATAIFETMQYVKNNIQPGDLNLLQQKAVRQLTAKGFRVDYVTIADVFTLRLQESWDGEEQIVVLVAAFLNEVRLIDNLILN
ncbi:pantoate--beta-alanine ligase [Ferruginibacter paludis]|uniref:pantoate--beta-alanine ligase n=1 Tax=Ferruginibacter paludis TaxID=1310417 RepID=UPI0025B2BCBB|nr:pantoate--beta-alanine ligase [Ferruginibacter paludis]MDN3656464.1 pantoate--beta-alanine ligase [Ferruginibacter paludis]